MTRYGDLDPKTRAAVDRAMKGGKATKERKRARPSAAQAPDTGSSRWRCSCGEVFTEWPRAKAHPPGPGHGRLEILLD